MNLITHLYIYIYSLLAVACWLSLIGCSPMRLFCCRLPHLGHPPPPSPPSINWCWSSRGGWSWKDSSKLQSSPARPSSRRQGHRPEPAWTRAGGNVRTHHTCSAQAAHNKKPGVLRWRRGCLFVLYVTALQKHDAPECKFWAVLFFC